ncbi:helix-hairpin-helix domain-containing protein [Pontibacter sp. G13]|uniref:ComEA family DNA-binding protein n=1 Tax=Pontibacter sp. G13 TaxID=3074898 RepID=UPI00288A3361|nr:helix-hairpin-helix domain-containing protein [Pontibacter sp. G13]WNJ18564.1 helix-hairpin-helix domain-containing protein [Pontibacter sp. G13]
MAQSEGFSFNRSQKRGIVVLFGILATGTVGKLIHSKFAAEDAQIQTESVYHPPSFSTPPAIPDRLDINLADSAAFSQLPGIGPVLSQRIVRFRDKSGGFESVEDLKKTYGLSEETFEAIQSRLFVNEVFISERKARPASSTRQAAPIEVIDVNTATAEEFKTLPGIGTTLSNRIVNYRNSIGGFQSIEDLKRVYHLSPETYAGISQYLAVKTPAMPVQLGNELVFEDLLATNETPDFGADDLGMARGSESLIDLNQADSATLADVPGIDGKLAKRIIKYRTLLGHFESADQLSEVYGFPKHQLDMALPHLVAIPGAFKLKDLNTASVRMLAFYPEINKEAAESIVAKRDDLGRFDNWTEVSNIPTLSKASVDQLRAYFKIEVR